MEAAVAADTAAAAVAEQVTVTVIKIEAAAVWPHLLPLPTHCYH